MDEGQNTPSDSGMDDDTNSSSRKSSNKSTMEKKRRERINRSLGELKSLILGSAKKDASYYSKLEKADILEMAVEHVRFLQTQMQSGQSCQSLPTARYRAGFATCANEMTRMLANLPGLDESVKFNLLRKLADGCTPADDEVDHRLHMHTAADNPIREKWETTDEPDRNQKENIRRVYEETPQSQVTSPQSRVHTRSTKKERLKSSNRKRPSESADVSIDISPTNQRYCSNSKSSPSVYNAPSFEVDPTMLLSNGNMRPVPKAVLLPVHVRCQLGYGNRMTSNASVWRPW